MAKPPNILWITTDHQRTDALGCYGSTWAKSPNIDRLAASGVRFDNCTCQAPTCTASRASIWTATYPHQLGRGAYKSAYAAGLPFLAQPFRDAGYQLAQLGKFDFIDTHAGEFDVCEYGPGPGAVLGPWCEGVPAGTDPAACNFLRSRTTGLVVGGINPLPPDQTVSAIMAARAEGFLAAEARPPFLLRLSIDVPHMPFVPLPEFCGSTDPDRIELSLPTAEELASKPRRQINHIRPFYGFDQFTPEELRYCRRCFYDLCTELDAAIGRVLDALDASGFREDTIVLLHSDHGTTLGEHGLGTIRTFYEPVVRIPFIWSWPQHLPAGQSLADPVEAIDIIPTLMELAGIPAPSGLAGRSLVCQALGETSVPDRPVFSEYDTAFSPIGGDDWIPAEAHWSPAHDRRVMVRHRNWKLECNYGPSDYGEDGALYDLDTDPAELQNLFNDDRCQPVIAKLQGITRDWLARTGSERI